MVGVGIIGVMMIGSLILFPTYHVFMYHRILAWGKPVALPSRDIFWPSLMSITDHTEKVDWGGGVAMVGVGIIGVMMIGSLTLFPTYHVPQNSGMGEAGGVT